MAAYNAEKCAIWQMGIGLQAVDGLRPSSVLRDAAVAHIEGEIGMEDVLERIREAGLQEADIAAARIVQLLGEKGRFSVSPAWWQSVHRRLFGDVFPYAGQFRPCNIRKKEWVLNGESVIYGPCDLIEENLDYVFDLERRNADRGLSPEEAMRRLAQFAATIWQIHPFCEGNTRSTAVFMVQYAQSLGFQVNYSVFGAHSWYFRNALVRANHCHLPHGVYKTSEYLERFFSNLLLGTDLSLENEELHI